jgi:benzodiazapine receptor
MNVTSKTQSAIAFASTLVLGLAIGLLNIPDGWYAALNKPWFNPPNWVFGPAWTALYILIALAGWRVWNFDKRSRSMKLWFGQMALNFAWSPLFFGAHLVGIALIVSLLMLASILLFIKETWALDRPAALMFAPYAAWVAFASTLNAAILKLN